MVAAIKPFKASHVAGAPWESRLAQLLPPERVDLRSQINSICGNVPYDPKAATTTIDGSTYPNPYGVFNVGTTPEGFVSCGNKVPGLGANQQVLLKFQNNSISRPSELVTFINNGTRYTDVPFFEVDGRWYVVLNRSVHEIVQEPDGKLGTRLAEYQVVGFTSGKPLSLEASSPSTPRRITTTGGKQPPTTPQQTLPTPPSGPRVITTGTGSQGTTAPTQPTAPAPVTPPQTRQPANPLAQGGIPFNLLKAQTIQPGKTYPFLSENALRIPVEGQQRLVLRTENGVTLLNTTNGQSTEPVFFNGQLVNLETALQQIQQGCSAIATAQRLTEDPRTGLTSLIVAQPTTQNSGTFCLPTTKAQTTSQEISFAPPLPAPSLF